MTVSDFKINQVAVDEAALSEHPPKQRIRMLGNLVANLLGAASAQMNQVPCDRAFIQSFTGPTPFRNILRRSL